MMTYLNMNRAVRCVRLLFSAFGIECISFVLCLNSYYYFSARFERLLIVMSVKILSHFLYKLIALFRCIILNVTSWSCVTDGLMVSTEHKANSNAE